MWHFCYNWNICEKTTNSSYKYKYSIWLCFATSEDSIYISIKFLSFFEYNSVKLEFVAHLMAAPMVAFVSQEPTRMDSKDISSVNREQNYRKTSHWELTMSYELASMFQLTNRIVTEETKRRTKMRVGMRDTAISNNVRFSP